MVELVARHTHRAARELATLSSISPDAQAAARGVGSVARQAHHAVPEIATPASIASGAVFLFFLPHVPVFRRGVVLNEWAERLRVTMRQVHKAGEKCFVDYSGNKLAIARPASASRSSCSSGDGGVELHLRRGDSDAAIGRLDREPWLMRSTA